MNIANKVLAWVKAFGPSNKDDLTLEGLTSGDETPLALARAVLLVDVALIDSRFDAREYEFVINTIKADLKLSDDEAVQLVKSASSVLQYRGSHSFAVELQKRLPVEERRKIAAQLKQLIAADSVEDGFEVYLNKKLQDLLGVDLR